MTVLILAGSFYIGRLGAGVVASARLAKEAGTAETESGTDDRWKDGITVAVDAGHGGVDSGKVGVNNALEKEINLAIAGRLKALLEEEGIAVVMTREGDGGLYDEGESNKKQQDMKRRCARINESDALLAVSIHQNSYTDPSVKGPQVFFYENSAGGKKLASILQTSLNETLKIERPRECRANDSYYLLRKTEVPTVIAECGFLSSPDEAEKLVMSDYQEKVAQALCDGILEYAREEHI